MIETIPLNIRAFIDIYSLHILFPVWFSVLLGQSLIFIMGGIVVGYFWYRAHHKNYTFPQVGRLIRDAVTVLGTAAVALLGTTLLKIFFHAPRPFIFFENLVPVTMSGGLDSFPSQHASFAMALAVAIGYENKTLGYILFVCALLVGLGRVLLGVHFPLDVLAGWVLGAVLAVVIRKMIVRR